MNREHFAEQVPPTPENYQELIASLTENAELLQEKLPASMRKFIDEQIQVSKEYLPASFAAPVMMYLVDQVFQSALGAHYSDFGPNISEFQSVVTVPATYLIYQGIRKAWPVIQKWRTRNERTQPESVS